MIRVASSTMDPWMNPLTLSNLGLRQIQLQISGLKAVDSLDISTKRLQITHMFPGTYIVGSHFVFVFGPRRFE